MTNGQQEISGDKEEADLEKAEKQFREEQKNTETVPESADPKLEEAEASEKTPSPKKEETAKENQRILAALGFKRYEDAGVIKYNIRVMNIKIGVTFNETNPLGKIWAYKIPEGDEEKKFLKNGDLKSHPLIQKYEAIKEGKEPLPETSVTGKILEKRGKAIKVEIIENGETKEIFFGQTTPKKDAEGYFIPAGFSKATKDHEAKMTLARDIRLPDYLVQLEHAPTADITKEKEEEAKEKGEIQPTDKGTLAGAIFKGTGTQIEEEKPAVPELIAKYVDILAQVTVAIKAEDRIQDREKGYAVKFVYYSVIEETKKTELSESTIQAIAHAILNSKMPLLEKEGDHEE